MSEQPKRCNATWNKVVEHMCTLACHDADMPHVDEVDGKPVAAWFDDASGATPHRERENIEQVDARISREWAGTLKRLSDTPRCTRDQCWCTRNDCAYWTSNFIRETAKRVAARPEWQCGAIDRPANVECTVRFDQNRTCAYGTRGCWDTHECFQDSEETSNAERDAALDRAHELAQRRGEEVIRQKAHNRLLEQKLQDMKKAVQAKNAALTPVCEERDRLRAALEEIIVASLDANAARASAISASIARRALGKIS